MQTTPANIRIIYHSGFGHTQQVAQAILRGALNICENTKALSTLEAAGNFEELHAATALVFGCPTYMGSVSAEFKKFMEATGKFWYAQPWKNKLAAGFTNSSTVNGDKLNTLQQLSIFAAQHSMLWISTGILPVFKDDVQQPAPNGLASYLGLMTLSNNATRRNDPPAGLETAELFGARIAQLANNYSIHSNSK